MNVIGEVFFILASLTVGLIFFLPYVIPYVRRAHRPMKRSMTKVLALDPNMFKAKRMATNNEHKVWSEEFRRLAGHTWLYQPEIWDEADDETILAYDCENHSKNEVCRQCEPLEPTPVMMKRQRRKP